MKSNRSDEKKNTDYKIITMSWNLNICKIHRTKMHDMSK